MKRILLAIILLSTVACDQASKHWARTSLEHGPVRALGGHLQLVLTENRGAFLSLGARLDPAVRTFLFTGLVAIALIGGLIWLFAHDHPRSHFIPLALIFGGGIGNLIDRASRAGAVTDFLFLRYGPLHTGVFNVADVFITAGAAALVVVWMRQRERGTA